MKGMSRHLFAAIFALIIVFICLVVFALLIEPVYGSAIVRKITCGILFWVPFGSTLTQVTHGCAIIPA